MGRIPQAFIDQLLSRVDVVEVIDSHVALKKTGRNFMACCPFHQEKTPSFSVSQTKQFYHCFGCGASGNAITFLMNYEGLSFPESVKQLANIAGLEVPVEQQDASENTLPLFDILQQAFQYYQNCLKQADAAIAYLKQRGLSGETAKQYGLGFAPEGWENILKHCAQSSAKQLLQTGLVIKNEEGRTYDRFRNRIVFPIRDRRGRVIGFGGRVLDNSTPKYLNSPETPVFHKGSELYGLYEAKQAQRQLEKLIIVEGYMDVCMLAEHGISYAVATLGTATTASHLKILCRQAPKLIFCFDGDNAGRTAAWRALEICLTVLTDRADIQFLFLPQGEDPDSYVKQHGKTGFEQALSQASSLSTFFFEYLLKDIDLNTADGRAKLNQQAMRYIQTIVNPDFKQALALELTNMTRIDNHTANTPKTAVIKRAQKAVFPSAMRAIIGLLLQDPKLAQHCPDDLAQLSLPGSDVLAELAQHCKANPEQPVGILLEHWRNTPLGNELQKLAAQPLLIPEKGLTAEFQDALKRLADLSRAQTIEGLMAKAATPQGLTSAEKQTLQNLLRNRVAAE